MKSIVLTASRYIGLLGAALVLGACAPASMEPPEPREPLVWPQPPAPSRISYVRSFSRPEDVGIRKGIFRKLGEWILGRTDIRIIRPMAVVTGRDGVLYVADPGAKAVHRFDTGKHRYTLIRRAENEPLPSPVGLARGMNGEVFVSDSYLDAIFVIMPGAKFATPMTLRTELMQPTGLTVDPLSGRLYVVDTAAHQVKVVNPDGTLHAVFGRRGVAEGEFNFPTMIWRDRGGRFWVTDSLNFRIQLFDGQGKFLGKFGKLGDATGHLSRPKGVATDSFDHVYVVDSLFHSLQIFDASGKFLLNLGGQGRAPGEFWLPTGVFIDEKETIYVADSHNRRVQVFRYIGGQP